jgi:hypothetical protein
MKEFTLTRQKCGRICLLYQEQWCSEFPCPHTPCQDLDYYEDQEDRHRDRRAWEDLWETWHQHETNPDAVAPFIVPTDDLKEKFKRCSRLDIKRSQIYVEIREFKAREGEYAGELAKRVETDPEMRKIDPKTYVPPDPVDEMRSKYRGKTFTTEELPDDLREYLGEIIVGLREGHAKWYF